MPGITAIDLGYRYRWSGVLAGNYNVTAKATDNLGVVGVSAPVAISVGAGLSITVAAGLDGATIDDESVLITGSFLAPPNSAVNINGQLAATTADGHFFANAVPLANGANSITATLITADGQTATQTIAITRGIGGVSTGGGGTPETDFRVTVGPEEGIIVPGTPLDVSVQIENPSGKPYTTITLTCGAPSPGSPVGVGTFHCNYTQPGTYLVQVEVKDVLGMVIYAKTNAVQAKDGNTQDRFVRNVYADMLDLLRAGNVGGAGNLITGGAAENYAALFNALKQEGKLTTAVDQLGTMRGATVGIDMAELLISRNTAQGTLAYPVWMLRGPDGIWRIEGM